MPTMGVKAGDSFDPLSAYDEYGRRVKPPKYTRAEMNALAEAARNADPNWIRGGIYDAVKGMGGDPGVASLASTVGNFVPFVGDAADAEDAARALKEGDYLAAALNGGAAALGTVPGAGDIGAGMLKAIFGGVAAKTANKAALKTAEKMAAKGASRKAIWDATGWFKGVDGKWRFEIDDSAAKLGKSRYDEAGRVIKHPELYRAYPDMKRIDTRLEDFSSNPVGAYVPYEAREHMGLVDLQEEIVANAKEAEQQKQALLHELQHATQYREGFGRGTNQTMAREYSMEPLNGEIQSLQDYIYNTRRAVESSGGIGPFEKEQLEMVADAERELGRLRESAKGRPATAWDAYQRTSGEVEARNVEKRMNMTPAQRRASPPWETQDIPDEQQIVRRR